MALLNLLSEYMDYNYRLCGVDSIIGLTEALNTIWKIRTQVNIDFKDIYDIVSFFSKAWSISEL